MRPPIFKYVYTTATLSFLISIPFAPAVAMDADLLCDAEQTVTNHLLQAFAKAIRYRNAAEHALCQSQLPAEQAALSAQVSKHCHAARTLVDGIRALNGIPIPSRHDVSAPHTAQISQRTPQQGRRSSTPAAISLLKDQSSSRLSVIDEE